MFGAALLLLAVGYPVAFSFATISMLFGAIAAFAEVIPSGGTYVEFYEEFLSMFSMMPFRIYGIIIYYFKPRD